MGLNFLSGTEVARAASTSTVFNRMAKKVDEQVWFCEDKEAHILATTLVKNNPQIVTNPSLFQEIPPEWFSQKDPATRKILSELINENLITIEKKEKKEEKTLTYKNLNQYCEKHPDLAKQILKHSSFSRFLSNEDKNPPSKFKEKALEILTLFAASYILLISRVFIGLGVLLGFLLWWLVLPVRICLDGIVKAIINTISMPIVAATGLAIGIVMIPLASIYDIINYTLDIVIRLWNSNNLQHKLTFEDIFKLSDTSHALARATLPFPTIATSAARAKNTSTQPVTALAATTAAPSSKADATTSLAVFPSIAVDPPIPSITSAPDARMHAAVSAAKAEIPERKATFSEEFTNKIILPFFQKKD